MVEPPVLEIKGLHKRYPGAEEAALRGVSLSVRQGGVLRALSLLWAWMRLFPRE